MTEITYRIHWLSFTVHAPSDQAYYLYDNLFKETFGPLTPLGNGGRGFKEIHTGLIGFKIYLYPSSGEEEYFHVEIPGEACDFLQWEYYQALIIYLESNFSGQYGIKRMDLAFDHVPFTPQDVEEAIINDKVRSLAKRESLQIHNSPYEVRDDGEVGSYTVQFGSRSSSRMIRVYNRRGFTRLELQLKDERAQEVAIQLLNIQGTSTWFPVMISHLRDFIDIDTTWWNEFISSFARAHLTISTPRIAELNRITNWLNTQVMPAFSVAVDALPGDELLSMINSGRNRRNSKYEGLVSSQHMGKGSL